MGQGVKQLGEVGAGPERDIAIGASRIQDDIYGKTYWLIVVDTARSWSIRQVRVLTELADEGTLLGVPPVSWGAEHRTYWRIPLGPDRYLTDTNHLAHALRQATEEVLGPAPEGRRLCYRCQLPADEPVLVDMEGNGSAVSRTTYACPTHAPLYSESEPPRTLTGATATEHEGHR